MSVRINNQEFKAEYLSTPEDTQRGMMGRKTLDGCMVFKLNKGHHSFHMKNCLIKLDIIFTLNGKITKIHLNCDIPDSHEINPKRYSGFGDYVIEFPGGTANNWKIGDRVYFNQ